MLFGKTLVYHTPRALSLVVCLGCESSQKPEEFYVMPSLLPVASVSVVAVDEPRGPRSHLVKGVRDPETRALLFLKPTPAIGHQDGKYVRHTCWSHDEGLVCIACYDRPKGVRDWVSVVCPLEVGAECITLSTLPDEFLPEYGIDPRYCEG